MQACSAGHLESLRSSALVDMCMLRVFTPAHGWQPATLPGFGMLHARLIRLYIAEDALHDLSHGGSYRGLAGARRLSQIRHCSSLLQRLQRCHAALSQQLRHGLRHGRRAGVVEDEGGWQVELEVVAQRIAQLHRP